MLAAAEADADLGLRLLAAELGGVDRAGADLLQVLAGQGRTGRLGDPAPVGVAAEQRRLDQRRVGDRPRDPLGLGRRGGLLDLDPRDPDRALAVADDLDRQLLEDRLQQALWPAAGRSRWCSSARRR
jgi:hypothetical protein